MLTESNLVDCQWNDNFVCECEGPPTFFSEQGPVLSKSGPEEAEAFLCMKAWIYVLSNTLGLVFAAFRGSADSDPSKYAPGCLAALLVGFQIG